LQMLRLVSEARSAFPDLEFSPTAKG
jgi:hypothetical protein